MGGANFTATQSNTIYLQGSVLINGSAPSVLPPIPNREIAFGNGSGITSLSSFVFTNNRSLLSGNNTLTDSSTVGLAVGTSTSTLAGNNNTILSSVSACNAGSYNSIISGSGYVTSNISGSVIMSSVNSCMTGSPLSRGSIISSDNGAISASGVRLSIIAGNNNTISGALVNNSAIIGGSGLTLNQGNTVLVPNLIVNNNITFTNVAGTATITAGTSVVVNNTSVAAGSKILVTGNGNSTFYVTAIVAGTSFTINAGTSGTYTIYWLIIN
jgi:fibronectin-binding autotransporter adhesin